MPALAQDQPSTEGGGKAHDERRGSSLPFLVAAAAAVVVAVGLWSLLPRNQSGDAVAERGAAADTQASVGAMVAPERAAETEAEADEEPAPPADEATRSATVDETEPEPAAAEEKPATGESARESDVKRVKVRVLPKGGRFWERGRRVGVSEMIVELKPGERRKFEAGFPGYHVRKVVVDGSEPEIVVGLRPKAKKK